jgi:hypothetical protein
MWRPRAWWLRWHIGMWVDELLYWDSPSYRCRCRVQLFFELLPRKLAYWLLNRRYEYLKFPR